MLKYLAVLFLLAGTLPADTFYSESAWAAAAGQQNVISSGFTLSVAYCSALGVPPVCNTKDGITPSGFGGDPGKYDFDVMTFDRPVYAVGGILDLPPVMAGLYFGGVGVPYAEGYDLGKVADGSEWKGFFGVTSDQPITSIEIYAGDHNTGNSGWEQPYQFSDLMLGLDPPPAATPEPGMAWLMGLGLLIVPCLSRLSKARNPSLHAS